MGAELELKLVFDESARLDELLRAPLVEALATGAPATKQLQSSYFDTPDQELARHDTAIRVRAIGEDRIQTVKTRVASGSGFTRGEFEAPLAGGRIDLSVVPKGPARTLLARVADRLGEVFETRFERTTRRLVLPRGAEIELAVDRGEVRAVDRSEPIEEAELELVSGDAAQLFEFALRLHDILPFRLEQRSKAARGYALHRAGPPAAVSAEPIELDRDATVGGAFAAFAASCVRHLCANESCARAGVEPRGVHQMRVATRRLRSAISLLRDSLPDEWTQRLKDELRWLVRELADAREWDVFLGETLAPLREATGDPRLDALATAGAAARERAYERVRAALREPRYTRLLLALGRAIESPPVAPAPAREAARDLLRVRQAKLRKAAKKADLDDAAWLHRLRIRFKKLRYATEFFGGVLGRPRRRQRLLASVKALQDALGYSNDVAATPALLATLPDDPALAFGRGAVAGWQAVRKQEARRRLPELLAEFRRIAPITS